RNRPAQLCLRVDHKISLRHNPFALVQSLEDLNSLVANSPRLDGSLCVSARRFLHIDNGASAVAEHSGSWNHQGLTKVGCNLGLRVCAMREDALEGVLLHIPERV